MRWLAIAAAAAVGAGCGAGGPNNEGPSETPVPTAPPAGAVGAGKRTGERVIPIPSRPPPDVPARLPASGATGSFEGIDFEAYADTLDYVLFLVDRYWSRNFPGGRGDRYSPPAQVIAYYPLTATPRCGGGEEGAGNADYCAARDFVGFDEPGFMIPFYLQLGPVANATIIAHEWGHVIQTRLRLEYDESVEKELNADCLAGVWAADAVEHGIVATAELTEAKRQLIAVGDMPGIPWQAPSAHGTGPQRVKAFTLGYESGSNACLEELRPGFSRGRPGVVP